MRFYHLNQEKQKMNTEEMEKQRTRMLGILNEANTAEEAYRRRRAEKALDFLTNPADGKKPTELVLNAKLDSDEELCRLRQARNAATANAQVSRMVFESWTKDVPANGPGPLLG